MPQKQIQKTSPCVDCGADVLWKRTVSGKNKGKMYKIKRCESCCSKNRIQQSARLHTPAVQSMHRKHYTKKCKECGGEFSVYNNPNAGIIKYCGESCRKAASSREHRKDKYISAMARERWRGHEKIFERARVGELIQIGHAAKVAVFISPCGDVYETDNVTHFVRTHVKLFDASDVSWRLRKTQSTIKSVNFRPSTAQGQLWCRAQKGLLNLSAGRRRSWKGWVCKWSESMKTTD